MRKEVQTAVLTSLVVAAAFFIFVAPDLVVALDVPEGYVWTPAHSLQWQVGDFYYYAAWVREASEGAFPPINPTAGELIETPSIESMKTSAFVLGALPSLLVSDFRWALLISLGLFPALTVLVGYRLARNFSSSTLLPLLTSFTMPFLYMVLLRHGGEWVELMRWNNFQLSDEISSSFRYVNSSIAFFILLTFVWQLVSLTHNTAFERVRVAIVVGLGLVLAFSYPPQALVGFLVMAIYAPTLFALGLKRESLRVFASGGLTLVVLLLIGYPQMMSEFADNTQFYSEIFFSGGGQADGGPFQLIWGTLRKVFTLDYIAVGFQNFLVTGVIALILVRQRPRELAVVISLVLATGFLALLCAYSENKLYVLRFLGRAMAPVWYVIVVTIILNSILVFAKERIENRSVFQLAGVQAAGTAFVFAIAAIVVALPLKSFVENGNYYKQHGAKYLPEDIYDSYSWIDDNVSVDANVVALDWTDVYLLPIYTDTNLVYGHWILNNRTVETEVERYLASRKFMGVSEEEVERLASLAVSSYRKLIPRFREADRGPLLTDDETESALIAHGLVYFPYITAYKGIPLDDPTPDSGAQHATNPSFVSELMSAYRRIDPKLTLKNAGAEYILASEPYWAQADTLVAAGLLHNVFGNGERRLYKLTLD